MINFIIKYEVEIYCGAAILSIILCAVLVITSLMR